MAATVANHGNSGRQRRSEICNNFVVDKVAPGLHSDRNMVRQKPIRLSIPFLACLLASQLVAAQDPDPSSDPSGDSGKLVDDPRKGTATVEEKITPAASALADAETSYRGALLLRGGDTLENDDVDVVMGEVTAGSEGVPEEMRIAGRFVGNTLMAEARDDYGNTIALIAEFYWFESSVPRGSDFFVGVVKAVNSPNRAEKWVLEHSVNGPTDKLRPDHGAVLKLTADTNPDLTYGGFRADWSIPFHDVHVDKVGEVSVSATYGVGAKGEGSAEYAYAATYDDPSKCTEYMGQQTQYGCELGAGTQVKGNFDLNYSVSTSYEIPLYTWDMYSNLSPSTLQWTWFLRNKSAEFNKAYREYFISMQTPEEEVFQIDRLELEGHYKKKRAFLPDERRVLSVAVNNILFRRPSDALLRSQQNQTNTNTDQTDRRTDRQTQDSRYSYEDNSFTAPPATDDGGCRVREQTSASAVIVGLLGIALCAVRRRRA